MRIAAAFLALLVLAAAPAGCQNVYPDPGFEASGETGAARTGLRSGHLAVGAASHWTAIGGSITVEPFARYRVREWVKASVGSGTLYAPYCYAWDSYEWAFVSTATVRSAADWTRTETTFVCPYRTVFLHPLAAIDAADVDARVDDVSVEKIEEPAQVIASIETNRSPSDDELRILARWYVAHGRTQRAAALLARTHGLVHADIATVLARAARTIAERRRYAREVVAGGGPTYHDGVPVFDEITRGLSANQRIEAAVAGALMNPEDDRAARSLRLVVEGAPDAMEAHAPLRDQRALVRAELAALTRGLKAAPAGSAAAREMEASMKRLDESAAALEARARSLGHCVLRIGGAVVNAQNYAIVVPDHPTPQESYAARELQVHLELATGEVLPIRPESSIGARHAIYIGRCLSARAARLRGNLAPLGLEGIRIRASGPNLALAGNLRGVLYAVTTFLQDYVGCRWFTPDCSTWPKSGEIRIGALNRTYIPPLEYRAGDYPVLVPGAFAARLRMNGRVCRQTEAQGGIVGVNNLAHTFQFLCPPEKWFATHPEYFSLVGGKRQSGYAQLCLTNPDVLKVVVAALRKQIQENPGQTVFSVSQNDTDMHCECDRCTAVAKEEASQSGPLIRFVNAVADEIKKDYPHVVIETLAYQYTRKPPAITKPRPNVIVCLCSIECCFIHPLATDPYNASFVRDIVGWSKICKRLWIWDYIINYAHSICPFPNLYVLKPNIQFFIEHGVKGIYEESCYYTKGSELQELRNYIIAQTLWDPNYDTDKAIDEFCAAYYGPAGPYVRRYITLIHKETQRDPNLHVTIYTHPRAYVTGKMIDEARALFDQAEAAVQNDPILLHRVQVARLPIMYAEITLARSGAWRERGDRLEQEGATDVSELADRFEKIARAEGVTMVREGGPDATLDAWLKSLPRRPARVSIQRLRNPSLQVDVLPEMGGRIWRMTLAHPQRDLLLRHGSPDAWDIGAGGYEEYSESGYRSPGWQEHYTVRTRSERSLTLETTLSNGLRLTREIELDPAEPVVTIRSTLTNVSGAPKVACLRVHPEFAVTDTARARVQVRKADGSWRTVNLANPADPQAEKSEWLTGADMPAGEWQVVDDAAGVTVTDRVPAWQLGQCLLNWSGAQNRVNLELYSPEKTLAPGESLSISHSYAVSAEAGAVR